MAKQIVDMAVESVKMELPDTKTVRLKWPDAYNPDFKTGQGSKQVSTQLRVLSELGHSRFELRTLWFDGRMIAASAIMPG